MANKLCEQKEDLIGEWNVRFLYSVKFVLLIHSYQFIDTVFFWVFIFSLCKEEMIQI